MTLEGLKGGDNDRQPPTFEDHVELLTTHAESLIEFQRQLLHEKRYTPTLEAQLSGIAQQAAHALEFARNYIAGARSDLRCTQSHCVNRGVKYPSTAGRKRSFDDLVNTQGDQKRKCTVVGKTSPNVTATVQYQDITAEVEQRLRDKASRKQREWNELHGLSISKRKRASEGSMEPAITIDGEATSVHLEELGESGQAYAKQKTHSKLLNDVRDDSGVAASQYLRKDSRKRRKLDVC